MKTFLLLVVIFSGMNNLQAQDKFALIDDYVKNLGALETFNVATIADTITRKFPEKKDKARAIFYWISNNISLDPKAIKLNDNKKDDPVLVVQARKATPLGFATLIQEMCSMANIRCLVVDGYIKNNPEEINNKPDEINHSWNVVQLGQSPEEWYYVDAAKASGSLDKKMTGFTKLFTSEYFFADKALFNLDHYPDNSAWQLGGDQKSLKEFYALPVIGNIAYTYGLQKPTPLTGHIKTKITNSVSFSFLYNSSKPITEISIIMGDERRQSKPEPMNFTDNGGVVKFSYKFKKADSFPVRITVDGKDLLQYYVDVEE